VIESQTISSIIILLSIVCTAAAPTSQDKVQLVKRQPFISGWLNVADAAPRWRKLSGTAGDAANAVTAIRKPSDATTSAIPAKVAAKSFWNSFGFRLRHFNPIIFQ
jgi:hypothetical protein